MIATRTLLALAAGIFLSQAPALAAVYTVTNTNDTGSGSLHAAITAANATTEADRIEFNIPGSGPHRITATTQLPGLRYSVEIDGTTQPGYVDKPLVGIHYPNSAGYSSLLELDYGFNSDADHVIRGLGFSGQYYIGINLGRSSSMTANTTAVVEGCWIGIDVLDPTYAAGGVFGVVSNHITDFTIGGTTPAQRNIISGNNANVGASFQSAGSIKGNWIGFNTTGDGIFPMEYVWQGVYFNDRYGISLGQDNENITVGGTELGAGNHIYSWYGMQVGTRANNSIIKGNHLGIYPANGEGVLSPVGDGMMEQGIYTESADGTTVGGAEAGAGNVFGPMDNALSFRNFRGASVKGNYIGYDPATNRYHLVKWGVNFFHFTEDFPTSDVVFGGILPGEANTVRMEYNAGNFTIFGPVKGLFARGNSIVSGGSTFLNFDNIHPPDVNDPLDADTGPNELQNRPVLSDASSNGSTTTITGTLHSEPNTTFQIDYYHADSTARDLYDYSPGDGQPKVYLGSKEVTTDGSGNASVDHTLTADSVGKWVCAVASHPINGSSSTSWPILIPRTGPAVAVEEGPAYWYSATSAESTQAGYYTKTLFSNGTEPVSISAVTFTGPDADKFSSTSHDQAFLLTDSDHSIAYFELLSDTPGRYEATANFTTNDPLNPTIEIPIVGYVGPVQPRLAVATTGYNWFHLPQTGTPNPEGVYAVLPLKSMTSAAVQLTSPTFELSSSFGFSVTYDPGPVTLEKDEITTFGIRFVPPVDVGNAISTLTLKDANGSQYHILLEGTAATPIYEHTLVTPNGESTTPVTMAIGDAPYQTTVRLTNTGNMPLEFLNSTPVLENLVTGADWNLAPGIDTSSVPIGAYRDIQVILDPTTAGEKFVRVTLDLREGTGLAAPTVSKSIDLTATVYTDGKSAIATPNINFGNRPLVAVGYAERNVTVTSNGTDPIQFTSHDFIGTDPANFAVLGGLPVTLNAPGDTATITVGFDPLDTLGSRTATLRLFTDSPLTSVILVELAGEGVTEIPTSTFTVNGPGRSTIGSGGTYTTLKAAADAINAAGALNGGDWTFEFISDTSEGTQVVLNSFATDDDSRVIFTLAPSVTAEARFVIASDAGVLIVGSAGNIAKNYVFDGIDRSLRFRLQSNPNPVSVFRIGNYTSDINIRNMQIVTESTSGGGAPAAVFLQANGMAAPSTPGLYPHDIVVENNLIQANNSNTGQGIQVRHVFTNPKPLTVDDATSVTVRNNDIESGGRAFFADVVRYVDFDRNRIRIHQTGAGFNNFSILTSSLSDMPSYTGAELILRNNEIQKLSGMHNSPTGDIAGVLIDHVGEDQNIRIYNNMFGGLYLQRPTGGVVARLAGIVVTRALVNANLQIEHNSVNIVPSAGPYTGLTAANCYALGITNTGFTGTATIRNNILVNGQPGGGAIFLANTTATIDSDNNNLYSATGPVGRYDGVDYTTVNDWTIGTTLDANSFSADPVRADTVTINRWAAAGPGINDLHFIASPGPTWQRTITGNIPLDVDGEVRPASAYVGADEPIDSDADGIASTIEDRAANNGDGNNDGIPDRDQQEVASIPTLDDPEIIVTLETSNGTLVETQTVANPSPSDAPANVNFLLGFYSLQIAGITPGSSADLTFYPPSNLVPTTYFKYGPTLGNPTPHWYSIAGTVDNNAITITLTDGGTGDSDLTADGVITDPGGPVVQQLTINDWYAY